MRGLIASGRLPQKYSVTLLRRCHPVASRAGAERGRHPRHLDTLAGVAKPTAVDGKNPQLAIRVALHDEIVAIRCERDAFRNAPDGNFLNDVEGLSHAREQ